eukprot:Filipodium_phascolosomae@DN2324_c0_g1_i11.p2
MTNNNNNASFVDVCCNLTDPQFKGVYNDKKKHEDDLKQIIGRAKSSGVSKIIVVGGSLKDAEEAIGLAEELGPASFCIFSTYVQILMEVSFTQQLGYIQQCVMNLPMMETPQL